MLTGEKRGAAGGAALLGVVLQEANSLLANPVNVGRFVAHQPIAIGADIGDADVVAEDDQDVRLFVVRGERRHGQ